MITIAHLSDPHLAPLPSPGFRRLMSKRMLGYMNWQRGRKDFHRREVADLMVADIHRTSPDHIVVTGDLVNLSLDEEFVQARIWLEGLGSDDKVTVVPGNHDAYVHVPWDRGLGHWSGYMTSNTAGRTYGQHIAPFPFVRILGRVAVVGLSSALPMPPLIAGGKLGVGQREALANTLEALGKDGLFRIILIHHPPLPGQNVVRKALGDAKQLQQILTEKGADLVLHGHNHRDMMMPLPTNDGHAHVIGVPSASAAQGGHRPAAQYNLYRIEPHGAGYRCEMTVRKFDVENQNFREAHTIELPFAGQPG
jgi:3',5'-cyclic AMP phosphodiesterase CpdA